MELDADTIKKAITNGIYVCVIKNVEEKEQKWGTSINITYEVSAPIEFYGHTFEDFFCAKHTNPQAEQIAQDKLKRIMLASGMNGKNDTSLLKDRFIKVLIDQKPDNYGEYKNYGKGWMICDNAEKEMANACKLHAQKNSLERAAQNHVLLDTSDIPF